MNTVLKGIHVVSLATNIPGPVAAARLSEYGAFITKVEPPAGDPLATGAPEYYRALTEGHRILVIDLKSEAGLRQLYGLLEAGDLLLTAHRPATLIRLSLDWNSLHARFPRLCQVAIVGFPKPHEDRPSHDVTLVAGVGLLRPPHLPCTLVADLGGAERAVAAALGLLLARERGEEAAYVEVALSEAAEVFALPMKHGLTAPDGPLGGGFPGYGLYAARDGHIAVGALEPQFVSRLTEALELPEFTRETLAAAFLTRTTAEWETWANEHGLPIAAVRT